VIAAYSGRYGERMKALVQVGPDGDVRYTTVETPKLKEGEALVKVMAAGICGSDPPRNMRKYPGIPGHELSGIIVELDAPSCGFEVGSRVAVAPLVPCMTCDMCAEGRYSNCRGYDFVGSRRWGAFAQYVAVPATNLLNVADNVSFEEAALVEPASVALHATRYAGVDVGSSVAIVGAGSIGLLVGLWARAMGASLVSIADVNPTRLQVAASLGFDDVFDSRKGDYVAHINSLTNGRGADIAVESAGSHITQRQVIEVLKPRGKAVLLGISHRDVTLPEVVGESILRKEITIQGSWAAYGMPFPGPDWTDTLEYMSSGRLDVKPLIDWTGPLSQGPEIYEGLKTRKIQCTKAVFLPNNE